MNAFDALRHTDTPVAPDRRFAEQLRARLAAELSPTVDLPERSTPMTDTATQPSTATPGRDAEAQVRLTPYLAVAGADRAIAWYAEVLGAREVTRFTGDDGRIGHAELDLGGVSVYVSDEYPDHGVSAPSTLGGSAVGLTLVVPDVDTVWTRALDAGAEGLRPPEDQPYGERSSTFIDPFGHRWMVQTTIAHPTTEEVEAGFGGDFTITTAADATAGPADTAPAEIGYVTMGFDDTDRAVDFYSALLGWRAEPGHSGEGYAHVANTRLPVGFTPSGAASPPELFFRVPDVAVAAARVTELGGTAGELHEGPSGTIVECVDDQGRGFRLWQPAPGY